MINNNAKKMLSKLGTAVLEKRTDKRTVWVVSYSDTCSPSETVKSNSFGYDDWEIYHGG